jgi:hypothetical protein
MKSEIIIDEPKIELNKVKQKVLKELSVEPVMPELGDVQADEEQEGPVTDELITLETEKVDESIIHEEMKGSESIEVKPEAVDENPAEQVVDAEAIVANSVDDNTKVTIKSVEDASLSNDSQKVSAEVSKMQDSNEVNTMTPAFVPDSITKDLMESIAKNLTLKIRLVNILREGKIKEESFDKLYKGYLEEGQIWVNVRDELIKKLVKEIDEMEETYTNSVQALELLEARRGIGEISEDEYLTKMPGYRWDVDHLEFEVGKKRNRLAYLEEISSVLTDDQISELRELAGTMYNTIESLEVSNDEIIVYIKSSVYDVIKFLG